MKSLLIPALAFCATGIAAFVGLALLTAGEPAAPYAWGNLRQDFRLPVEGTPWASMLHEGEMRNPPGSAFPVPRDPTPTPTATPELPPPTPAPVYVPPAADEAPEQPQAPSGDIPALICSFGWDCATALAVARCESGLNPSAVNGPHVGVFQMNANLHTWRSPTGELWSAYGNISAAWHLYLERGWQPWSCA